MTILLRLLMVEDSADDELLVIGALKRHGYDVRWTRVEEASALVAALGESRWDILTSDWSLPRFGALAALPIVRSRLPHLPIVVVSGTVDSETAAAAVDAGAHDVGSKWELGRLPTVVERLLRDAAAASR
jgi:two-component system phosphate regulon sensor histidine kinase PhoR